MEAASPLRLYCARGLTRALGRNTIHWFGRFLSESTMHSSKHETQPHDAVRLTRWHWVGYGGWVIGITMASRLAQPRWPYWLEVGLLFLGITVVFAHADGLWRPGSRGRFARHVVLGTAFAAVTALGLMHLLS